MRSEAKKMLLCQIFVAKSPLLQKAYLLWWMWRFLAVVDVYNCVCEFVCVCVCMFVCVCACVCVHIYVQICHVCIVYTHILCIYNAYVYVCTYIYIYTWCIYINTCMRRRVPACERSSCNLLLPCLPKTTSLVCCVCVRACWRVCVCACVRACACRFICVTWLIRIHLSVCVTRPMHTCDMTHSHVWLDSESCLSVDQRSLLRKSVKQEPQIARSRQAKCRKLVDSACCKLVDSACCKLV